MTFPARIVPSLRGARTAAVVALGLATLLPTTDARAEGQQCAASYVSSQKLRRAGKLLEARKELISCARDCLPAVMKECGQWLTEVNGEIPTVVLVARDGDGSELTDVRVFDGDSELATSLDGKAVELDPGLHELRFVRGKDETVTKVTIKQGQKNRSVEVTLGKPTAVEPKAEEAEPETSSSLDVTEDASESTATPYLLGGLSALGFIGAGYFWLSAEGKKSDLEDSGCAPACSDSDRDSIDQARLFGDISLGVGLVSLGILAYVLTNSDDSGTASKTRRGGYDLDLRATRRGGFAGVSGRF